MPFETLVLRIPEVPPSPARAPEYLVSFLRFVEDMLDEILRDIINNGPMLAYFNVVPIAHMPGAMEELRMEQAFGRLRDQAGALGERAIIDHGLFGRQLMWKLANVRHHLDGFIAAPSQRLLGWLFDAIEDLLGSLISGMPLGGAVMEILKALRSAARRHNQD